MDSIVPNPPATGGEDQSTITPADFLALFARQWKGFVVGLLVVAVLTFGWSKLFRTVFYRTEVTFSVGSQYTSTSRIGLAESDILEANRSDKMLLLQINQAMEWLQSRELLLEVTERLAHPAKEGQPVYDIYKIMGIMDDQPDSREYLLVKMLKSGLTSVQQVDNCGLMVLRVELPDPSAAAAFANTAMDILQERYTADIFRYPDQIIKIYESELNDGKAERKNMAQELLGLSVYDMNPKVQERRELLQTQLRIQAEELVALEQKIQNLRVAIDPRAKAAAQPVSVIARAYAPMDKYRPQNILTAFLAAAIFVFVYVLGLVCVAYVRVLQQAKNWEARR